jgi:hypothetical protein
VDEGLAFNPLPRPYLASVRSVESGRLGLLSKDVSVVNKSRLWHCKCHLSTVETAVAWTVMTAEIFWLQALQSGQEAKNTGQNKLSIFDC